MTVTRATAEDFQQPVLQFNDKSKLWRLVQDYEFTWGDPGFRKRLFMEAGFEYDKASVPKLAWGIFRPDGPWEAAALFHDRLYRDRGKFLHPDEFRFETQTIDPKGNQRWNPDSSGWKRKDADALLEYMGVLGGASKTDAKIYRAAVALYPVNWFKGF